MVPVIRTTLTVLVTLAALAGFAAIFGLSIAASWRGATPSWATSENFIYVATALAGLVGGIVAVGFGQKPPDPPAMPSANRVSRSITGLGNVLLAGRAVNLRQLLGSAYAIVYFVLGLGAITVWALRGGATLELVKNLASVSFGLFIAIARAFLSEPE